MKKLTILISLVFISLTLSAQSNYNEAIQQGDDAQKRGDYSIAINKYFAAEAFDPSKKEVVRQKVKEVFTKVDNLRKESDRQREETEKAKSETEKALQHANKLINAFYFYYGKFALAYGSKGEHSQNVFYFIDKSGDFVEKLGYWKKAEQFTYGGFAKVVNDKNVVFLLDTLGNTYKYTDKIIELDSTIQALDLSQQKLSRLPEEIKKFNNLKYLNLSSNQLNVFPFEIGKLNSLIYLDLASNKLSILPAEIGELTNLTGLYLSSNDLNILPAEIGNLKNLTTLDLNYNRLNNLPEEIGNLTNLTMLFLKRNQLKELPARIGNLKILTTLYLSNNQLKVLPTGIGNLKNLTNLDLGENKLNVLPAEIGNLKNLTKLDLNHNQLNNLPSEIGNLTNLTSIDIWANKLEVLPIEIGNLNNLKTLNLDYNKLSNLPAEIGNLKNLTTLRLISNQLNVLPAEIGNLKNLTRLVLSYNQLYVLPTKFFNLNNLKWLYLGNNQLTVLPTEVGNLTALNLLNVSNNQLSDLPIKIGNLKNLQTIYLEGNPLTDLSADFLKLNNLLITTRIGDAYCEQRQYETGISYYEKGLIFTKKSTKEELEKHLELLLKTGKVYYYNLNEYSKAKEYFQQCIDVTEQSLNNNIINDKYYLGASFNALANCYQSQRKNDEAETYYQKALAVFRELNQESNVAVVLNNLGKFHYLQEKYEESNQIYIEFIQITEQLINGVDIFLDKDKIEKYQSDISTVLFNIGRNYYLSKKYPEAENYFLRCLIDREPPKKEKFLRWSEDEKTDNFPSDLYEVLYYLFHTYSEMNNYSSAIFYLNKCNDLLLKYKENIEYNSALSQNYGSIAWCYLFTKEYAQSEQSARQALKLDNTQTWIKTNLAHALLFQNRFSEAEKIYKELSQTIKEDNETYTQDLLNDFDELEKANVIPEKHKGNVEKIRKMLKGQ